LPAVPRTGRGRTLTGMLPAPPPANDARATPRPQLHERSCPCLTRLSDQSGEIRCDSRRRAGEVRLPPARPLTGMFSPPGYSPPTVIVSDLLNLGTNVDILLDEVEVPPSRPAPPAKSTLTGLPEWPRGSAAVRLQSGRPLRPASVGKQVRVHLRGRTG
jgi:hypothetical protein